MIGTNPLYTVRQYRLFISGSRQATPAMLQTAYKAVERAKANGWAVLVGDAQGVDAAVIETCNALQVNYVCFGISAKPRNRFIAKLSAVGKACFELQGLERPRVRASRSLQSGRPVCCSAGG